METEQPHTPGFNLFVREEDRSLPANRGFLVRLSTIAFERTGQRPADISLVVCTDDFISRLNARYRGVEGPTDVLSFPQREGVHPEPQPETVPLGDIVISEETAQRQGEKLGRSLQQEFSLLFVHGLLHLLGYDHDTRKKKRIMDELTNNILSGVIDTS